jgi:hypothetical protein
VSDEPEDLEVAALQRQLDDAFETTRPRAGFEDELWTRMQAHRPAGSRLRDAWVGLVQAIREAPTVPMAAVAAVLVVVLGAGAFVYSGLGRGGAGSTTANGAAAPAFGSEPFALSSPGTFGKLPGPVPAAGNIDRPTAGGPLSATSPAASYIGYVALKWTGKFALRISTAPVFRYHEPSTNTADQFASSLGAVLVSRPAGFLGSYQTSDFSVRVRGTIQSPPREPSYTVLPIAASLIDGAGAPMDLALVFLGEHSLAPTWQYTPDTVVSGDVAKVTLARQFGVTGYGYAYLVDASGDRYGAEVDLQGNRPISAIGPIALNLESAPYSIISADQAVQSVLASSPVAASGTPTATLTSAELVYTLVAAGDHSFYEPSFLFSGTFTVNGTTYVKRVLVPAVDASQRSP